MFFYIDCMFGAQYVRKKGRNETSALTEAGKRAVSGKIERLGPIYIVEYTLAIKDTKLLSSSVHKNVFLKTKTGKHFVSVPIAFCYQDVFPTTKKSN